ncbi:GNAT family N-acetyltransferase [Candidatus Woesebacteria bacterium]|nr:GNAT family N-acetyltransferase [Candidatus Woesebacteria bacterium]
MEHGQSFHLYRSEDGRLAGVMQTVVRAKDERADLHLMSLAVSPEFRGTGLSQVMMKRFYELAEKKSLDLVTLRVDPLNTAALKLYLKEGFVVVGARTRNLGGGYENIVTLAMSKSRSIPFGEFSSSAEKQQCQIDGYQEIDSLTAEGWIGVAVHDDMLALVRANEDQRSVYKHWR